ncbi:Gfo/Idh/MocA family oxidoreductase [soil metagenome]
MENSPLKLGILGFANIAQEAIIPAAGETDAVEITAVATRGESKTDEIREIIPEAGLFEDYDSLVESNEVDAVYIPLPNSLHVDWTLKALEAGKHVLCEKPFSLDADGAEKAVEAARKSGLTIMEGFMFRLHPQTQRLKELIEEGAIGAVRQVVAQFGHLLDDPEDVRGIGSLGGGSLGDVGCYAVSGVRLAFGGEPRRASAFARFDEDDADQELAGVLEFDEGLGIISCSISSARRERLEIIGADGRLILEAPFRADKSGGSIEIQSGDESETESFEEGDPYLTELEEFAAAIREQREPAVGPAEILGNARAIGALLESARQGGRVQSL